MNILFEWFRGEWNPNLLIYSYVQRKFPHIHANQKDKFFWCTEYLWDSKPYFVQSLIFLVTIPLWLLHPVVRLCHFIFVTFWLSQSSDYMIRLKEAQKILFEKREGSQVRDSSRNKED